MKHFKLDRILALLGLVLSLPPEALACATCFGDSSSTQTQGMNVAIGTLLGVTLSVLFCIAFVIGRIILRVRRMQEDPGELPLDGEQPGVELELS
ncbi:MAG: hypothetical protein KJ052_04475 [Candidatus Hydrogenedentes bacterium]|nr:hypothetical protein [Candidatus Hydrogenedentota bacterium]